MANENRLYRIEVLMSQNLPDINCTGLLLTNEGMAYVKIHPVKLKAAPKKDIVGVTPGRWIKHPDDLFPTESMQECSVCGEQEFMILLNENYCPNCGAKMNGGDENG